MLEDNEKLNAKADGLDVQRVMPVDSSSDRVRLARELEILDAMTLPFFKKKNKLLPSTTAGDGEADDLARGLDVEEASEP